MSTVKYHLRSYNKFQNIPRLQFCSSVFDMFENLGMFDKHTGSPA